MGIERVRYRRPVHPGDTVEIEAVVKRLRSRMGVLSGAARVNGKVVCDGTMTFALGPKTGPDELALTSTWPNRQDPREDHGGRHHHPHVERLAENEGAQCHGNDRVDVRVERHDGHVEVLERVRVRGESDD